MLAGAVVLLLLLSRVGMRLHPGLPLCLWRDLTGFPCPFCGGTRALQALSRGELGAAAAMNPVITAGALLLLAWPLGSLLPRPPVIDRWLRNLARPVLLGHALLLQWGYFIIRSLASPSP